MTRLLLIDALLNLKLFCATRYSVRPPFFLSDRAIPFVTLHCRTVRNLSDVRFFPFILSRGSRLAPQPWETRTRQPDFLILQRRYD